MRALVYARVSLDQSGEGRSVDEQVAECQAWADREGWTVAKVITETGSASRYARGAGARTKWAELTTAVASREHDILLTWEASRATRQLAEYAELADLCAAHKVLWGYSGTVHDLTTRDARFRTGLDALLAQDESARTSERIQRSVRARAAAGRPHGKVPYGYRREYDPATGALLRQVPDETTAPIVREVYARVGAGETLYSIARDLTARGVPMPRPARSRFNDAAWIPMSLRQMVRSPTYIAQRTHKGTIVADADWPALVTQEAYDKAGAVLDRNRANAANPSGDSTAKHLLTGIARCGTPGCGGPMRRIHNRGSESYHCRWCMGPTRLVAKTDDVVTRKLLALLEHAPNVDDEVASADVEAAREEARTLRERLEDFEEQATDGELSAGALARAEQRLLPRIRAAEQRARELAAPAALAAYDLSDPRALWESLTLPERRELVRAAVTVTILPAGAGHRTWRDELVDVAPTWA